MQKFRLPRKIKKKLKGKLWLYPADEKGHSLMAWPRELQADYTAIKQGLVRNLMDGRNTKAKRKEERKKLDKEIIVTDEELTIFVAEIFAEEYRESSYDILIRAKTHPNAIVAYYNFINAYKLNKQGEESYSNICCLAVDEAKDLLKKKRGQN